MYVLQVEWKLRLTVGQVQFKSHMDDQVLTMADLIIVVYTRLYSCFKNFLSFFSKSRNKLFYNPKVKQTKKKKKRLKYSDEYSEVNYFNTNGNQ